MNRKLLELIKVKFKEKLQTKTGWGRNEVLAAYDEAVTEALMEVLES